jgi:MscS family membrane protein
VGERLSLVLPDVRIFGLLIWQWVTLLGLILFSFGVAWLLMVLPGIWLARHGGHYGRRLSSIARGPLLLLVATFIFFHFSDAIAPPVALLAIMRAGTLVTAATAWLVIGLLDLFLDHLQDRLGGDRAGSTVLIPPLRSTARVLILLIALLVWLENVGFRVTTLVAGLGVGGVAIALAAQKSLEDIFAAITLYSGRPVRVGDFCRFGQNVGTVEEIGLRWTKIRTLNHTLVGIPNSELAKRELENYGQRRKIWFHPRIQLRYETTPDQLRWVLAELRKLLFAHPRVLNEDARVRFTSFGSYSLDLDVYAYLDTTDYAESLEITEDLNLRIMDVVDSAGTGFAFPSQTAYVEQGAGMDLERGRAAEAGIGELRAAGRLPFPQFSQAEVDDLRGSIAYPPEGSQGAHRAGPDGPGDVR